jgi:hypothetical protein
MVLGHLLPSVQPQSLEWTHTSFEQFVVEFCAILLEENLQVALRWEYVPHSSHQTDQSD